MTDKCKNCAAEITEGSIIKTANRRASREKTERLNSFAERPFAELCGKCGAHPAYTYINRFEAELAEHSSYFSAHLTDFPMMTVGQLPLAAKYKIKSMVTANVTVGTGFLSEFSQGLSDMFGATNTATGMAYKVNSGEATARSIIINKAMSIGANCVIGVDVDYGTTLNNAATVNMQGTAVVIDNLSDILHEDEFGRALKIRDAYEKAKERRRWAIMLRTDWT